MIPDIIYDYLEEFIIQSSNRPDILLPDTFKIDDSIGDRRQDLSRGDGIARFHYSGDQMPRASRAPLVLSGVVQHETTQQHLDWIIDLYAALKTCTFVVLKNNLRYQTDSTASIRGFVTREQIDSSDRTSLIRVHILVDDPNPSQV